MLDLRLAICAAVLAAAWLPCLATAQSSRSAAPPGPSPAVRAAMASGYSQIDKAYASAVLSDSVRSVVNQQFDRSTLNFLFGKFSATLAGMDSVVRTLTGGVLFAPSPLPPRLLNGQPPSVARDAFLVRLAKIDSVGPLGQALVSARARAGLLVDVPAPERRAELLNDPAQLARDLAHEVGVLERGRNPYVGQAGDAWRVFRGANGALIPMRIVAPAAAATSSAPVPVVIALHGAGGDENLFADAYGQGAAAATVNAAYAILVSPAVGAFGEPAASFDSLMAVLRAEYRINDKRVYVLGHSMGAGIAAKLAQQRPQQIAAVACIAGGSAVTAAGAPPVLFIGAAMDAIAPPATMAAAAKATPTGTLRMLDHEGHTLMVGNAVRLAVPWLLAHRP